MVLVFAKVHEVAGIPKTVEFPGRYETTLDYVTGDPISKRGGYPAGTGSDPPWLPPLDCIQSEASLSTQSSGSPILRLLSGSVYSISAVKTDKSASGISLTREGRV